MSVLSVCTKRCWECRYHGEIMFDELCCDYILITNNKRGCPAGDKCRRFEPIEDKDVEQRTVRA